MVRNRGTIGGSLAHADPAADFPAVVLALGATIRVEGPIGRPQRLRADDFFTGLFATGAASQRSPHRNPRAARSRTGTGMAYEKFPHPASRYAVVGVAAVVDADGRRLPRRARGRHRRGVAAPPVSRRSKRRSPARRSTTRRSRAACRGLVAADDLLGDQFASASTGRISWTCWRAAPSLSAAARARGRTHQEAVALAPATRLPGGAEPASCLDMSLDRPTRIEATLDALDACGYVAERELATSVFLALRLQRPLLLEGEPGVGKTEIARVLAAVPARPLIRLQCYEGLDVAQAVYDWDYARQMLHIRLREASGARHRAISSRRSSGPRSSGSVRCCARSSTTTDPAAGAAHRRDRSRRRGVRGVPARAARRLADHHPGSRHDPRGAAAGRRSSPRTGRARCTTRSSAAASITGFPIPPSTRSCASSARKVAGLPDVLSRQIVAFVAGAARPRSPEAAGHRRDARLGRGAAALGAPEITEAVAADTIGALVKSHDDFDTVRTRIRDLIAAQA